MVTLKSHIVRMTAQGLGNPSHCPVCTGPDISPFQTIDARAYWACATCEARFLARRHFLSRGEELATYLQHENHPDDPQYRSFLSKLADPLLARLPPGARGLDYGCGPGPALAEMLCEAGHEVALYDPFFAPDPSPLSATYDLITCTETVEHFHTPHAEFARLRALLRPGGWLAVMTCFQTDDARFADWHYRKDLTHVVFYRAGTFQYLARAWGWGCEVPVKDVALMQRPLSG